MSAPFAISNGVKQGCVLAPTLFSLVFAALLSDAFKGCDRGIYIRYRTNGGLFNLRRLQAKTKVITALLQDLLFADDCALVAHTLHDTQQLVSCFAKAAENFGLTISLKKTEVVYQPRPGSQYVKPTVLVGTVQLNAVEQFCYLGSVIAQNGRIDDEINRRISAASGSFGNLEQRLWRERGISLSTKVSVYRAVVLSSLLYGCETWTVYRQHLNKLTQFHMCCLRHIARITWQQRISNEEVLQTCCIPSIEKLILRAQLRWSGHVMRMDDHRLPKQVFYGELLHGVRDAGGQKKRYKDTLKANLKACSIDVQSWEAACQDRAVWRSVCDQGADQFEAHRAQHNIDLRHNRKLRAAAAAATSASQRNAQFTSTQCGRECRGRIGLYSHSWTHRTVPND
jgi:hypothetical protein